VFTIIKTFFFFPKFLLPPSLSIFTPLILISLGCFIIGFFYRLSAVVLFCAYGYLVVYEMALYDDTTYLVLLLLFLFLVTNANARFALDAYIPFLRTGDLIPRWQQWCFQAQVCGVFLDFLMCF